MRPLLLLLLLLVALTRGVKRLEKSVIEYLGTNHILYDGCPAGRDCDAGDVACERVSEEVRAKYSKCAQSAEGQDLGCVTYRINGGAKEITVPVYANKCSAICYEEDPIELAKVVKCPHQGFRQHDPELRSLF